MAEPTDIQPTVNIDGTQHIISDLSEKTQYYIGQLQDLQNQQNQLRGKLDQVEMAMNGFLGLVRAEIANQPDEDDDEDI